MQTARDLYDKILEFEDEAIFERLIKPWIAENNYANQLKDIFEKLAVSDQDPELSWELYALSRVLDTLTLRLQPDNAADGDWPGPPVTLPEYTELIALLGLEAITPQSFDAFHCEIMEVRPGTENFKLTECFFPAVKLGGFLIKRAGVSLLISPDTYDPDRINSAIIYWAYRRKNRKYKDLSQGWGGNSQWTTGLRLDSETTGSFAYNPTGKFDLNNPTREVMNELKEQQLEISEAIELVKFRHFITSPGDDTDLFPYDFRYEEQKKG